MISYTLSELVQFPEMERLVICWQTAPWDGELFEQILLLASRKGLEWTPLGVFADEECRFDMAFEKAKEIITSSNKRGNIFRCVRDIAQAFGVSGGILYHRWVKAKILPSCPIINLTFPIIRKVYPPPSSRPPLRTCGDYTSIARKTILVEQLLSDSSAIEPVSNEAQTLSNAPEERG